MVTSYLSASGKIPVSAIAKAPIFDYRDFERLEHEGWQEFGGQIERLREHLGRLKAL